MTAIHLDIIHGDHFIRTVQPRPVAANTLWDPLAAARSVPGAESVKLNWLVDRPTYIVTSGDNRVLLDARTGSALPAPTEPEVRQLAAFWFTGEEPLTRVALIDDLPGEVRGRKPPLRRAEFDGWNKPTLYFSPNTGERGLSHRA